MRHKLKPTFRAAVKQYGSLSLSADTLELQIYEDIGPGYWGEPGLTAATVKQAIDAAGIFSRIAVRINSPGGDVFDGIAIYNLIRAQRKPVDVFVDGIAASAASVIAMAGDTITMGIGAMMMIHNAWTVCAGEAADMRQCADLLDKVSVSASETYQKRSGKSEAEVKAIMDASSWLSAQDCIDQGFATTIAADSDDAEQMALAKSFKSLAKLKNVPAALRSNPVRAGVECSCPCGPCKDGDCVGCSCTGCQSSACTAPGCDCGNGIEDDDDDVNDSNLSQYEARLKLLRA